MTKNITNFLDADDEKQKLQDIIDDSYKFTTNGTKYYRKCSYCDSMMGSDQLPRVLSQYQKFLLRTDYNLEFTHGLDKICHKRLRAELIDSGG